MMPIALKELVDLLLVGPTDFSQRGMRARYVDVLLSLGMSAEFAAGSIWLEVRGSALCQVVAMGHPVEDMFCPPTFVSRGFVWELCEGCHQIGGEP